MHRLTTTTRGAESAQSRKPGDVMLDPFCGSGSVGVAAVTLGRRFVGVDVAETAAALTEARLTAVADELEAALAV